MATTQIPETIESEISRLVEKYDYSEAVLKEFASFILRAKPKKTRKPKKLKLNELKAAIYKHFNVKDTPLLKKDGAFQLATSGMGDLKLGSKDPWEKIYRKVIGILPGEENEQGYGCVNGVNIFKYDRPWAAFGLDPKIATTDDVKTAYRNLSKIYHPDNKKTGDGDIFNRLNVFYESLTQKF